MSCQPFEQAYNLFYFLKNTLKTKTTGMIRECHPFSKRFQFFFFFLCAKEVEIVVNSFKSIKLFILVVELGNENVLFSAKMDLKVGHTKQRLKTFIEH